MTERQIRAAVWGCTCDQCGTTAEGEAIELQEIGWRVWAPPAKVAPALATENLCPKCTRLLCMGLARPTPVAAASEINEALQASAELARALTIFAAGAIEGRNSWEDGTLALLQSSASEWLKAFALVPTRNACCGNQRTHSEGGREFCSTCGAESPAKRWV